MSYEFKVEEYNLEWNDWFEQLKTYFENYLSNLVICIEHVGSTAIPNMVAKPIIDMDIVIKEESFNEVKAKLEEIGYLHQGDLGIKEREAFKLLNEKLNLYLLTISMFVMKIAWN